jgi:hypothetical protein
MKYTRTCKKCKEVKPITFFDLSGGTDKHGDKYRRWECKKCRLPYKRSKRKEIKERKLSILKPDTLECSTCGYSKETHPNFTVEAIQFHHTDNNKEFNVGDMWDRKFEYIKTEIEKCIPLCVRCHAEISQKERE